MTNILRFQNPNPVTTWLSDNWQAIRDEYVAYRRSAHGIEDPFDPNPLNAVNKPQVTTAHEKRDLFAGQINALPLFLHWEAVSQADRRIMPFWPESERTWNAPWQGEFPLLMSWARQQGPALKSLVFYLNQPGSVIRHHYGPERNYPNFRIHLGFTSDPAVEFDLENDRYSWTEGDIMAFDDAMVYHGVRHRGQKPRLILTVDYAKEALMPWVQNYEYRPFSPKMSRTPPQIVNWDV